MSEKLTQTTSRITLHNTKNQTVSHIILEGIIPNQDTVLKVKPTDTKYITKKYLAKLKANLQAYQNNPTLNNTLTPPMIISYKQIDQDIIFKLTAYETYILLPYVGVEYTVSTAEEFQEDTIVFREILHNLNTEDGLSIQATRFQPNQFYYIKTRYLGGGYYSNYSNVLKFKVTYPLINQPSILTVDYDYGKQFPYLTNVYITSSPFSSKVQNEIHESSVWKVYRRLKEDVYDLIYVTEKDTTNLTSIRFKDLIPKKINHDETYFITVTYYGNQGSYSLPSDYFKTISTGIKLLPFNNINIFPKELNITNLLFTVEDDLYLKIGEETQLQPTEMIEHIEWEVEKIDVVNIKNRYVTQEYQLQLTDTFIAPKSEYIIRARYKHKYLGYSPFLEKTIRTKDSFSKNTDKLIMPKKIYKNTAYFGEITNTELMLESVIYTGNYNNKIIYHKGEEVRYEDKGYVCIKETPQGDYKFLDYFKPIEGAKEIYKSYLPTPKWLLENIGLNPYLTSDETLSTESYLNLDTGWIKLQNERNQIIYMTKKPILRNISVNDLIRKDLFHPRRRTVRIGNKYYYIRLLVSNLTVGYDSLDPLYTGEDFNKNYSLVYDLPYNEDKLLLNLINSNLANYNYNDLELPIEFQELIYSKDGMFAYKYDGSTGKTQLVKSLLDYADNRTLFFRPVLELIEEEQHPFKNISSQLPVSVDVDEEGEFKKEKYYDPYLDAGYLGYVPVSNFISSEAIDFQSGLFSGNSSSILGWYKFYYRGLVYFIPNGINLKNVKYKDLNRLNMITPTPLFNYNTSSENIKFGKMFFNNMIFNISCPNGLKYTSIRENIKTPDGLLINLFENKNENIEPDFNYDTFLSDVIYSVLNQVKIDRSLPGYKGRFKRINLLEIFQQFGNGLDENSSFLLSDIIQYNDNGVIKEKAIINYQKKITRVGIKGIEELVDVISCLTINPVFDKTDLW